MGWASGSDVMIGVIHAAKKAIPTQKKRKAFYEEIVAVLDSHDWDTHNEAVGYDKAFDELYDELYPDEDDFDDTDC